MSRLLPTNQALKEQRFAEFVDESLMHDNSVITLDPLTCHSSLLEHIALGFGASIAGMNENEARLYLSKIERIKTQRGTAGAVEDTLGVTFEDAELVEWFEVDDLDKGDFRVEVTVKTDTKERYDKRKFALSKRLINEAKNVRSHLAGFEVKLPTSKTDLKAGAGGVIGASLSSSMRDFNSQTMINMTLQAINNITLSSEMKSFNSTTKYNLGGAIVWTI